MSTDTDTPTPPPTVTLRACPVCHKMYQVLTSDLRIPTHTRYVFNRGVSLCQGSGRKVQEAKK